VPCAPDSSLLTCRAQRLAESLAHHSENVGIQFYSLQQDYIGRKKFALHLSLEPLAGGRGGESRCFPRTMSPAQPIEQFGAHPTEPVHRAMTSLKHTRLSRKVFTARIF
jgi:hypothetical protein